MMRKIKKRDDEGQIAYRLRVMQHIQFLISEFSDVEKETMLRFMLPLGQDSVVEDKNEEYEPGEENTTY